MNEIVAEELDELTFNNLAHVKHAIEEIRLGKMVVLFDDQGRENEGDLVLAAEKITPEAINFMTRFGRGLICLTMLEADLDRLNIPMMTANNRSKRKTAFTVSIGAKEGITTGISAADRAKTIEVAVADNSSASDVVVPGHIFPLKACSNGVLERGGQTEGSMEIARLAGLKPAGVICEILNLDGTMARLPELQVFCQQHNLTHLSVKDLIHYRLCTEILVKEINKPTAFKNSEFSLRFFSNVLNNRCYPIMCSNNLNLNKTINVYVYEEALEDRFLNLLSTEHQFGADRQIKQLLNDNGVLIYLPQRFIDLEQKTLNNYVYNDQQDKIHFGEDFVVAHILKSLKAKHVKMVKNDWFHKNIKDADYYYGVKISTIANRVDLT